MTRPRKTYGLPDGSSTTDVNEMAKAWHEIADPIAEVLGGRLSGFDPGVQIAYGTRSLSLTAFEARKISEAIRGKKSPNMTHSLTASSHSSR